MVLDFFPLFLMAGPAISCARIQKPTLHNKTAAVQKKVEKKTRGKEGIGLIFTIFTPSTQHEYENTCNIRHFNPSFLQLRGSWEKAYKASDRTHQWQATEKMRQQMLVTLREHVL